jgi:predicted RNA-binding Zn ribbon-like protein
MGAETHTFELTGGALCLDFANTMGDRPRCTEEHLSRWADLLAWAAQASVVSPREASALKKWAAGDDRSADAALAVAKELREGIYRIFAALATGGPGPAADLALLNRWLGESVPRLRVVPRTGGYDWGWEAAASPDRVLWPVVWSAAQLLVSPELADVRECQSDRCSWLFIDRSRTKQRRWCSMRTCGNRAKVRRFQERRRAAITRRARGRAARETDAGRV